MKAQTFNLKINPPTKDWCKGLAKSLKENQDRAFYIQVINDADMKQIKNALKNNGVPCTVSLQRRHNFAFSFVNGKIIGLNLTYNEDGYQEINC